MDYVFQQIAALTGASIDQTKLIAILLVDFPIASIYVRIPPNYATLKHFFSISMSMFSLLGVLRLYGGFAHLLLSIVVTWILLPWKHEFMPWTVFVVTMTHLLFNHLHRVIFSLTPDVFDVTYIQMTLVIKLTTLAWNIHDARRPEDQLDKQQRESMVSESPTLLEFLGFCLYFPSLLVGPAFEYRTYIALISGTLFSSKEKEGGEEGLPRGRRTAAYTNMAWGLLFMGLWVFGGGIFAYQRVLEDSWLEKGVLNRLVRVQLTGIFQRTKYYAVWMLAEGACILTGLGFNGYSPSGQPRWDRATNVHIWQVETAPNFKILFDNWNVNTNIWLRNCIYKRVTPRGKKPGFQSTMLTFLVSAIWHGTETGYYLTFLQAGFVQTEARLIRSYVRPFLLPPSAIKRKTEPVPPPSLAPEPIPSMASGATTPPAAPTRAPEPPRTPAKVVYDILSVVCTAMELNYCVAPFLLLNLRDSLTGWSRMYWYGTWMTFGPLLFFVCGGRAFLQAKLQARAERDQRTSTLHGTIPPVVIVPPSPIANTTGVNGLTRGGQQFKVD